MSSHALGCGLAACDIIRASFKKHCVYDCRGVRPNREADWHPSESHPGTQIPQRPGIEVAAHPSDPRAAKKIWPSTFKTKLSFSTPS